MHAIEKDAQNLYALECLFDALVEVETQQIQEGWHHDLSCLYKLSFRYVVSAMGF